MIKKYIITFSVSVLVAISSCLVALMLVVPQQSTSINTSIKNYDRVNLNDYKFEKTKDISKENLLKEYTISYDDLNSFKKYNQYQAGNSDPFTPKSDQGSGGNQGDADDNTTNGNGGTPNPPSSNK